MSAVVGAFRSRVRVVAEGLDCPVVFRGHDPHVLREPGAHGADPHGHLKVGVLIGQCLRQSALAQVRLVQGPREPLGALVVIPLRLAGGDGAQDAAVVVVLVDRAFRRLPAEEPLLADAQRVGSAQSVPEVWVAGDEVRDFGARAIVSSCISTTATTRSRRSA